MTLNASVFNRSLRNRSEEDYYRRSGGYRRALGCHRVWLKLAQHNRAEGNSHGQAFA
jgi:hypothetical protein